MADTSKVPSDAADTLTLPTREAARQSLGEHEIFRQLRDEKMGPVRNLSEAGLTKIVVAYQDKKGIMRSQVFLVSHETCEAAISLLGEEQLG